jgi:hypothetical protein
MSTPDQLKAGFYHYLDREFGSGLIDLIRLPAGVRIGERVLYMLLGNEEAERADTKQTNREVEESFARLADQLSEEIGVLRYSTEPAIDSGLPYPRAVDIPYVSDLALGSLATRYAASPDELPEKDFSLLWLFGVIFTYSAKYLLYLDFAHPKLRAVYVAEYDAEYEFSKGRDILEQFKAFMVRQAEIAAMIEVRQDVCWAKLVQIDTIVQTMIKTCDNLVH